MKFFKNIVNGAAVFLILLQPISGMEEKETEFQIARKTTKAVRDSFLWMPLTLAADFTGFGPWVRSAHLATKIPSAIFDIVHGVDQVQKGGKFKELIPAVLSTANVGISIGINSNMPCSKEINDLQDQSKIFEDSNKEMANSLKEMANSMAKKQYFLIGAENVVNEVSKKESSSIKKGGKFDSKKFIKKIKFEEEESDFQKKRKSENDNFESKYKKRRK